MRSRRLLAVLLALAAALATSGVGNARPPQADYPRCVHPYPCGDEWPRGLSGPFRAQPAQRVTVEARDGTPLGGYLFLPKLPAGVRAPTVLISSPYDFAPGPPGTTDDTTGPIDALVADGFAVAEFSVRGTGRSGGCFENKGRNEQRDQADLVEWLAAQPWSNGRVGMIGLSYPGTTPMEALVQNPPHLKAIIAEGTIGDPYTEIATPQGAMYTFAGTAETERRALVGVQPVALAGEDLPGLPAALRSRACSEVLRVLTQAAVGQLTDARDERYWDERRLIDRFPQATAAVMVAHGLHDASHPFQEDPMWQALHRSPKHFLLGQWGHVSPGAGGVADWTQRVMDWFGFWLKGVGPLPATVGTVEYQDGTGEWRRSRAWPPAQARQEVLYLGGGQALEARPKPGSATYRSVQLPRTTTGTPADVAGADGWPLCVAPTGTSLAHLSPVLHEPVLIAGNPFAYLRLSADQPGGIVSVGLYDLAPEGCGGAKLLAEGAADLRFHDGRFRGRDFPTDGPQRVRVDLTNLADVVEAGHRIAVVVSGGELVEPAEPALAPADRRSSRWAAGYTPTVTLHGGNRATASHVVLPVIGPGLGGAKATLRYPPRPFVPAPR
jgi:X-Pro dipeptidyl-peptidase